MVMTLAENILLKIRIIFIEKTGIRLNIHENMFRSAHICRSREETIRNRLDEWAILANVLEGRRLQESKDATIMSSIIMRLPFVMKAVLSTFLFSLPHSL